MFDGLEARPAGQRRLLRLADRLDQIRDDRFCLHGWVDAKGGRPKLDADGQPACGTVCCAVGYAAMLPEFKAEGFKLVHGSPYFGGSADWWAVEKFFEIPDETTTSLFMASSYHGDPTGSDVAAKIREHVAADTKELAHV